MNLHRKLLVLLFAFVTYPVAAQVDRATLTGTVTDSTGSVIVGARVEAVSTGTALRRETITSVNGAYELPGLPIGRYVVTILKAGFKVTQYTNVDLSVGQSRTLDAQMEVGEVTSHVEVVDTAVALNRSSAEVGTVVQSQQVRNIPLNGRNWATLGILAPGAINASDGTQRNIRFAGRGRDDNNFTFDGIDATGVQEQSQKADARLNISLDSIAEFRVSTAVYTAESGSAGGAQINAVSKTGTNNFHGAAFEFFRNNVFDARSPFNSQTLPLRMNQFGANVGGPIAKNRTFFFAGYEGIRQSQTQTLPVAFVPNASFRAKVLATSPALKPILDSWPTGQTPFDSNTDQYKAPGVNSVRENSVTGRVDHSFSDHTTMFARYNIDDAFISKPFDNVGSRDTEAIRSEDRHEPFRLSPPGDRNRSRRRLERAWFY